MPFTAHDGLMFHTQELGSGPPAVMLHGLLVGTLASWYFSAAPAVARTHRVLVYDLRGHGRSERAAHGYDVATMAGDLEAVAGGFTREPMALVGHSYGAVVALHFALAHPERVRKLVLVEAPLPPSRLEELHGFLERPPAEMLEALPGVLRAAVARGGRQALRLIEGLRFLATESSLVSDLRRAQDMADEVLATLRCPVLCLYGARSSCRPTGERLGRVIPGARLITLDGGHFLPLESPRALSACITEFLDG
jgi:pimeloyl-ACP methyl ester carboxylesterase